jgi:hypothetical protein
MHGRARTAAQPVAAHPGNDDHFRTMTGHAFLHGGCDAQLSTDTNGAQYDMCVKIRGLKQIKLGPPRVWIRLTRI